ncbi:hypothetical protein PIB30_049882 [Stylosanthes scabra]|uniref:Uncharacterized protein n=1 Tax=Stylosanthes scabra TaxID=79078 RepID=A0ABU6WJF0_9FABA|nr:hypothetical protein [Stylosanthes scabra]
MKPLMRNHCSLVNTLKQMLILLPQLARKRRTKKRHEAINAAPLQPRQQGEADANPDAAIDALADPSTQVNVNLDITPQCDTETQEDHTKDADSAAAMAVEEEDTQHDAVIVDATIATTEEEHTVPAAEEEDTAIVDASIAEPSRVTATGVESAEEENTHHNAMLVDAAIEMAPPNHIVPAVEEEDTAIVDASIAEPSRVIEEAALTDLVLRITTHQNVAPEKNLEESVTRPEEEASEQELTLRDLPEIQKATAEDDATSLKTTIEKPLIIQQCLESTSLQKQPVIVLALEKAGDKESVAVTREPRKAELTQRDLADSDECLNFTPPTFKLPSSQDEPQQEEIHGKEVKAVGPINEPSSQEFEEIVYTQGTLDRLDKEMNDVQMKIAEKKLERILKLREELRELENAETPQKPETSRTRNYNWATQCTNTN